MWEGPWLGDEGVLGLRVTNSHSNQANLNLPLAGHTSAINDFVAGAFFSIKAEPVQISFCILSWFVTKKTHPPGPKIIHANRWRK